MIGEVIGNYRVVSELGKGGMGMVYRAEHVQLGRPAAIKMLLPALSSDNGIVQRFFNEARAASAIDHPGIVEIYDFGTHTDGRAYIVMALLKGESLETRLQRGPIAPMEGATILAQVVGALGAAHTRGIVHRDLKPDNIFLTPNELMPGGIQIKLLDFGIAKLADEQSAGFKTQTGALMGTPAYMSPEQCMGKADLDHRTDIYAIGCILFHVLCGRPPFLSEHGTGMMIAAHIRDAAPDPRTLNPNIPESLAVIIRRCLEKEPVDRFQTAAELRAALAAAGASAPSKPPGFDQYAATMAPSMVSASPTTRSGSAGQMVASSTQPPQRKSKAWLVVVVLLGALGGVGVVVAVTSKGSAKQTVAANDPTQPTTPTAPPATPTKPADSPALTPPLPAGTPEVAKAIEAKLVEPSCAPGQSARADTQGHCCWPEQAWSMSKNRCVGKPSCPSGTSARGETCVEVVAEAKRPPMPGNAGAPMPGNAGALPHPNWQPPPEDLTPSTSPVPLFKLSSKSYAVGGTIEIQFAKPVSSKPRAQAWVTVVEAGKPPSQYGTWEYVKDGARIATLKAPTTAGAYEVRVHTDYPTKSTNVRHSVPVTIGDAPQIAIETATQTPLALQRFKVTVTNMVGGEKAEVTFPKPLRAAPGEKFWVTVVAADAAPSSYGGYEYVPDGARSLRIAVPNAAGDYEIRLHANYPTKSTNVVHRAKIRVDAP